VCSDILEERETVITVMFHVIVAGDVQVQGRCLSGGWNGSPKNRPGIPTSTLNCAIRSLIGLALSMKNISFELTRSSYTIFECLFIFSVSKLLLNAASYDGEIWHAAAWRPCPGLLLVFVSVGVDVTKNDILKQKYLNVNKHFAALTAGRLG